jgi:hypothetical protein
MKVSAVKGADLEGIVSAIPVSLVFSGKSRHAGSVIIEFDSLPR